MPECFFRLIEKSFLVALAMINNNTTARTMRNIIIVTGVNSAKAIFVAINETPQDTTANNGFQ
jgi:lysine/ornithine N-monooxygenase